MRNFKQCSTWLLCAATLLWAASCSNETQQDSNQTSPDSNVPVETRDVMLTLKNQLVVPKAGTKAGDTPIATPAENAISTLDVYVFGSETENGDYSFQQRFAFRANPDDKLPEGADELQLVVNGNDSKESTALLKLKKGLFVKLYCIANDTRLIDPANEQQEVEASDFKPLILADSQSKTAKIHKPGEPSEETFTTFHTRLLDATATGDTLATPLAMAGAWTTPLDLTNFDNSARVQAAFRLTRLSSRIDIHNQAETSRFIIETVSMGHARRGAQYFPIRVYGLLPEAEPDELITSPLRLFGGENANNGLCTGAFYCYPATKEDQAFLILNGKYQVNETEMKEVSYQIPFQQKQPDGSTTWLDLAYNHRYTVAITDADEYHLQANIAVADWNDEGSIDNYKPDNTPDAFTIKVPTDPIDFTGVITYDADAKLVSIPPDANANFQVITKTNSALKVSLTYQGNVKDCPWLSINDPLIEPIVGNDKYTTAYTYTISLNSTYHGNRYPRATFRFMDLATGNEQILFVKLTGVPVVNDLASWPGDIDPVNQLNEFDVDTQTANLFVMEDSQIPFSVTCSDEIEVQGLPDYLEMSKLSQNGDQAVYVLKLTKTTVTIPADGVQLTLVNKNNSSYKQTLTVKLVDATVTPSFADLGGTGVEHTPGADGTLDNVTVPFVADNSFTLSTLSVEGVTVDINHNGGSQWLTHEEPAPTRAIVKDHTAKIKFNLVESNLPGAKPVTVTLVNKVMGGNYSFTVTPAASKTPTLTKSAATPSVPAESAMAQDGTVTMFKLPAGSSTLALHVAYLGGSTLTCSDTTVIRTDKASVAGANEGVYTLTALKTGSATLTIGSPIDTTASTEFAVNVVPPLSTDAANDAINLEAATTQTAKIKVTSLKGFTAAVTDWGKEGNTPGNEWFTLSANDFNGGATAEELTLSVKADIATMATIKPAQLTLTNKFADGDDKVITVTPTFSAPALTLEANSASPVQNGLDADNKTLKLYKLTGSQIQIKATSVGQNQLLGSPASGITVTPAATSSPSETVYTIQLPASIAVGDIADAIVLANKSDNTKQTKIKVSVLNPDITVPAGDVSLNLGKDETAQKESVTSPEGFTAADADIDWDGGSAWFTLTTTAVDNNGSIGVKTIDLTDVSPDDVKAATVTLKNKIAGGADATFKVNPVWMAPTANTSNADNLDVMSYKTGTFTVNVPFGGIANAVSADANTASVTTDADAGKVTYTGKYYSITGESKTVSITVANAKDANKTISYTVNVQNLTWATGDLVADGTNGAKIGAPTDKGLHFPWGSLVGYDPNDPTTNPAAVVYPADFKDGAVVFLDSPQTSNPNDPANAINGTGDPCKFYLSNKWRMPTADEYCQLGGNVKIATTFNPREWVSGENPGTKCGPNKALFFRASGYRSVNNPGNLINQESEVYGWSTTLSSDSSQAYFLYGTASKTLVARNLRATGRSVRCVQEP